MDTQNTHILEHKNFWGTSEELLDRSWKLAKALGLKHTKINLRLVRYYATEGVLDKPNRLGREAAYNFTHLLQLVLARQLAEENIPLDSIKMLTQKLSVNQLISKIETPINQVKEEIKIISARHNKILKMQIAKGEESIYDLQNNIHDLRKEIQQLAFVVNQTKSEISKYSEEMRARFEDVIYKTLNEIESNRRIAEEVNHQTRSYMERMLIQNNEQAGKIYEIEERLQKMTLKGV